MAKERWRGRNWRRFLGGDREVSAMWEEAGELRTRKGQNTETRQSKVRARVSTGCIQLVQKTQSRAEIRMLPFRPKKRVCFKSVP